MIVDVTGPGRRPALADATPRRRVAHLPRASSDLIQIVTRLTNKPPCLFVETGIFHVAAASAPSIRAAGRAYVPNAGIRLS